MTELEIKRLIGQISDETILTLGIKFLISESNEESRSLCGDFLAIEENLSDEDLDEIRNLLKERIQQIGSTEEGRLEVLKHALSMMDIEEKMRKMQEALSNSFKKEEFDRMVKALEADPDSLVWDEQEEVGSESRESANANSKEKILFEIINTPDEDLLEYGDIFLANLNDEDTTDEDAKDFCRELKAKLPAEDIDEIRKSLENCISQAKLRLAERQNTIKKTQEGAEDATGKAAEEPTKRNKAPISEKESLSPPIAELQHSLMATKDAGQRLAQEKKILTEPLEEEEDYNPALIAHRKAITALKARIAMIKDDELLEIIQQVKNNDQLVEVGINAGLISGLFAEDYLLIVEAAKERQQNLLKQREEQRARFLNCDEYQQALAEDGRELDKAKKHLDAVTQLDDSVRKELSALSKLSPIHWFNPGFQTIAKKHATEMENYYERLARNCNVLVKYLRILRIELNHQLASLPSDLSEISNLSHKKAIQQRSNYLEKEIKKVQTELDLHEPLQKKFFGDCKATNILLRQGILKTLKQAKSGQFNVKFLTFASNFVDIDRSEKEQFFGNYSPEKIEKATSLTEKSYGASTYKTVPALKEGKARLHTINPHKKTVGCFIEEQAISYEPGIHGEGGLAEQVPEVKFTVNKFPQGPDPDDPELVTGRVEFAIAMASEFLSRFDKAPSKGNPIIIEGDDPIEQQYIWTALMILGREVPDMKFDQEAIIFLDPTVQFRPEKELMKTLGFTGFKYEFAKDSCYATRFMKQPALKDYLLAIKEASTNKFGHQEGRKYTKAILEKASCFFFKPQPKEIVEGIKMEIEGKIAPPTA
ncbi:hypothetical protein [Legionella micdadei]|uniref:Interaptin n=1 Tax=Legionella micdadei TaxID=451 RepID=A0A098GK13_LEGMI|nr:hypothetical protein [Legionella micdadei]ARG96768.1 hypothetical protein B6N58_03295 [Legionella micdadei]KTD26437.1 interaptin [Legionella micdadei]NSL17971.1 hypothetical protein [Legionella micdadei]CEG61846.1 protein of unknown function [Legionella micdadei]SCY25340.1 hypothetical protein SAMN02982997_01221 [Legionella micdadei]